MPLPLLLRCVLSSLLAAVAAVLVLVSPATAQQDTPLRLHFDADFTYAPDSARAIAAGLSAALDGARDAGFPLQLDLVLHDHFGSPRRTTDTIRMAQADMRAIAMIGGMHSPNYIANGALLTSGNLPLLLPWSAGAGLTRLSHGRSNTLFRLSVDDRKVGSFMSGKVVSSGCRRIALIVQDNAWGDANGRALNNQLLRWGRVPVARIAMPMRAGEAVIQDRIFDVATADPDCAVLVTSTAEGFLALNALAQLEDPPRVFSHWGILGGGIQQNVPHEVRERLHLQVLETCGLRIEQEGSDELERALTLARRANPEITTLASIPAHPGFVHGYDLGKVLVAALEQALRDPTWNLGGLARRRVLFQTLEKLEAPVEGILKTYETPFSHTRPGFPDAHEALDAEDLCLARFGRDGQLRVAVPDHAAQGNP